MKSMVCITVKQEIMPTDFRNLLMAYTWKRSE